LIGGINNDVSLFQARLALQRTARAGADALLHLATGQAINSAADGPAALIAGTGFDSTLAELDAETDTDVRASNQAAVADAGLSSITSLLNDAKSVVSANADSTLSDSEKRGESDSA